MQRKSGEACNFKSAVVIGKEHWLGNFAYEDLNDGIPVLEKEET